MANTFTQINIHIVFAVSGRRNLILESIRGDVEKYIATLIQNRGHKVLALYCMPDHIHIFIGKRPTQSESELVRDIKTNSSAYINKQLLMYGKFSWQTGFGAFSHSNDKIPQVIQYIRNQPMHHQSKSFKTEFIQFLEKYQMEYDPKFLFEWVE